MDICDINEMLLQEAITFQGIRTSSEILLGKMKILSDKLKDRPNRKIQLKSMMLQYGKDVTRLARSIDTKKTLWQKVRGYQ